MGMGCLSLNWRLAGVGGIKRNSIESKSKSKKNEIQGAGAVGLSVKAMAAPKPKPKLKFKYKGTQMREKQLTEMIEKKVKEAEQVCLGEGDQVSDECKVAWDEVEEISQAKADFRLKLEKQDPLDYYCQQNPHTDECRIYHY
ncbi:hypothetical protein PanWU01x14_345790 [Parasponia andersonii]|uniref:CP12 domain-containing protein n=1 Tax=Parasponia andersonii TaxID=3476 RepID=A0A2P5ACL3_PARAD|nr:hypothetical protein PanWU01x14_345790 [Parasponia andersonii]